MLDVKKTLNRIISWISNREYAYKGYGTAVDISGYTSASDPYTCPKDGLMRINCNYRSGSYIMGYVDNDLMIEGAAGSSVGMQGNNIMTVPVFKGQKLYITRSSTYSFAHFIPFMGGGST